MAGSGVPDHAILDTGATVEAHLALRGQVKSGAHDPAVLIRLEAARSTLSFGAAPAIPDGAPHGTPERLDVIASAGIELR
jgi:hypothetical protein